MPTLSEGSLVLLPVVTNSYKTVLTRLLPGPAICQTQSVALVGKPENAAWRAQTPEYKGREHGPEDLGAVFRPAPLASLLSDNNLASQKSISF